MPWVVWPTYRPAPPPLAPRAAPGPAAVTHARTAITALSRIDNHDLTSAIGSCRNAGCGLPKGAAGYRGCASSHPPLADRIRRRGIAGGPRAPRLGTAGPASAPTSAPAEAG